MVRFELLLLSGGLVLALDYASKELVMNRLDRGPSSSPRPWPQIRRIANARIGLGLIRDRHALLSLWGLTVLGTILLIQGAPPLQQPAAQLALGAALGGATGNLLDWLRRGVVVDFIDLRLWPVFNISDTAIVLGMAVALWSIAVGIANGQPQITLEVR
jgi:signal peptidase II